MLVSAGAFASVPLQAQWIVLGLAGATFLFLFFPLFEKGALKIIAQSLRTLVRFPVFWAGLLLLILMLIQGLNPSWRPRVRYQDFRMFTIPHYTGLPTGVDTPFDLESSPGGMNAFRQMLIFGAPWLFLCALWAGVRSRRIFAGIAWTVLLGAVGLAAWGATMRLGREKTLLGRYTDEDTSFFATFLYQNHAGAWLSLAFAVAVALALWHWEKTAEHGVRSGPHLLCAALAGCLVLGTICTLSFGSMLTTSILLLVVTPAAILWSLIRRGTDRNIILGGTIVSILIAALAFVFYTTSDLSQVEAKLTHKLQRIESKTLDDRAPMRRATWQMINAGDGKYLATGWGAGSYRWVSPHFFHREPEFRDHPEMRANYAHCDWLQMLSEWGIVGFSFVALAFLGVAAWFLRNIKRWTPAVLPPVCAVLLFVGHASMDFLNYSMPLLCMLGFTVVIAARLGIAPQRKKLTIPENPETQTGAL
ncbi:MAG: O-antigen ligase family protein [Puniceicoccales bacterium]|nr:O-antigen ligase family protein [Puniceicoccales bacterium]